MYLRGISATVMERWTSHAAMMLPRIYRWSFESRGRSPLRGAAYPRVLGLRLVDDREGGYALRLFRPVARGVFLLETQIAARLVLLLSPTF